MPYEEIKGGLVPIKSWTPLADLDSGAFDQLRNTARLADPSGQPYVWPYIASMPDAHQGYGVPIGTVIPMPNALSPSAVGVDIGCGMAAIRTSLVAAGLPDDLGPLRSAVEAAIPVGFNSHDGIAGPARQSDLWDRFKNLHEGVQDRLGRAQSQVGTLGGGNHFIELCLDENDNVWVMIHSGSRNIGKEIAEKHIKVAKAMEHNKGLPDPELALLLRGTDALARYEHDLFWAQDYAAANRQTMMRLYQDVLRKAFPGVTFKDSVACHHNYVEKMRMPEYGDVELFVTRKGAISAREGQLGIIPGSMGTKSYIVRGKGNAASFWSASHGAGRTMSRAQAKRQFTLTDLAAQTAGIECRKDAAVIDEIPGAYKDIDVVMANQADLVEPVHTLRQVMCVKG